MTPTQKRPVAYSAKLDPRKPRLAIAIVQWSDNTNTFLRNVGPAPQQGFELGTGGIPGANLACSILTHYLGRALTSYADRRIYHDFKWEFVAKADDVSGLYLNVETIAAWLAVRCPAGKAVEA